MRNSYRGGRQIRRSTRSGGFGIGRIIFALVLLIFSSVLSAVFAPSKRRN